MIMCMFKTLIKYSQEAKLTEENKTAELNEEVNKGGKDYVPRDKYNDTKEALKIANEKLLQIDTDAEKARVNKLSEDGEFQKVIEAQKKTIESLQPQVDDWNNYKSKEKESLLGKLPEEKREAFKDTSITVLREVVAMQTKTVEIDQDNLQGRGKAPYKNLGELATAFGTGKITQATYKKEALKFRPEKGLY